MARSIVVIAHNIRSVWNVGAIFRTSDAFNIQTIYLTGYTARPPSAEIHKTALGSEEWIEWKEAIDPKPLITSLKQEGFEILSLEKSPSSVNLYEHKPSDKVALILGHEIAGVSEELQALSDTTVHIPMLGKKESLNVSVACGIALYALRFSSIN